MRLHGVEAGKGIAGEIMNVVKQLRLRLGMIAVIVVAVPVLTMTPPAATAACVLLVAAWMVGTRAGRQSWAIARTGIATIPQRLGSSAVVVVGIASVVGVLVALLAMGAGVEATLKQSGSLDTAIVLQAGSRSEIGSRLPAETIAIVSDAPQVLRNAKDQPMASAELVVTAALATKHDGRAVNVGIRGVGEKVWELRPDISIIEGRMLRPGLQELIVGRGSRERLAGSDVGSTLKLNGQPFSIVGVFDSKDVYDSELWADRAVIASTFRRDGSAASSLKVQLTNAQEFEAFKVGLASDPRVEVETETTREFYNKQAEGLTRIIQTVCATVGVIMTLGAIFGALNAMYAAVADRSGEIAVLRAMGFRRVPVIASVLLEILLLAVLGGLLGVAVAWAAFDGFITSTTGGSGQVVFAFHVSPRLLWDGLTWALAIGLIGGLFPAARAAHMPITAGLRGT